MLKLFIFTLTLVATIPAIAMQAQVKTLCKLNQRRYATMKKEDFAKLQSYSLSPKKFASTLAQMPKDTEDLDKLWMELYWKVEYLESVLDANGEPSLDDGSSRPLHFYNPEGVLHAMEMPMFCVMFFGVPLTALAIGASVGGEVGMLMLKLLQAPETREIACKSILNTIEHATLWCAGTTVAASVFTFFPTTELAKKHLQRFSFTYRECQIKKEQLAHVTSLIECGGSTLPMTVTTESFHGIKVTKYVPRREKE